MDREIGRIRNNSTTEVVVKITEYKGSVGVDIREFVTSERYTGWSKSGTRIPEDKVCQMAQIIMEACREMGGESTTTPEWVACRFTLHDGWYWATDDEFNGPFTTENDALNYFVDSHECEDM